ncbi:hypothetical protein F511_38270 [Dorcoceras hygrometricum]|uniref:Uncharacterized protein n=1 Tax=Dorcoceras hygrometricum TaxID=472368 RepID=A0A2Z7DAG3_9LAMI|nr:hypothetical protein F511_38270 [Dorcoceras hygrometricum]
MSLICRSEELSHIYATVDQVFSISTPHITLSSSFESIEQIFPEILVNVHPTPLDFDFRSLDDQIWSTEPLVVIFELDLNCKIEYELAECWSFDRDAQAGSAVYFQKCREHQAGSSAGCWSSTNLSWTGQKISSWNSKGTPKLVPQFTSRSAGNIKLVHQLDVGAARRSSVEYEEQFKNRIKGRLKFRVEVQNAQVQNSSSADQVQCKIAVIECEERTSWKVSKGRRAASTRRETSSRCPPWTRKNLHAGGEQTKNQPVKDKPAGQNLQEQIMIEDLSSEDDEGQLERRSAEKSKLEDLLQSGCK